VPRRTNEKRTQKHTMVPARDVDEQVLELRKAGASYSAIARSLELARAVDAHRSFVRAVSARDGDDRQKLIDDEEARLDQLEQRIRERDAADPGKVERRLLGVTKLREAMG
jgi:hypothetical protein